MILLSVGTQKQQFSRFFDLVTNANSIKDKEIIAQSGYTKYSNENITFFEFISLEEMEKYIEEAELVICHGGVGTILSALQKGKKVIAIPRLKKYGEHINDHQIEICEELEKEGYILYYKEGKDDLDELITKIQTMELKEYKSEKNYIDILRKEI